MSALSLVKRFHWAALLLLVVFMVEWAVIMWSSLGWLHKACFLLPLAACQVGLVIFEVYRLEDADTREVEQIFQE